MAKRAITFINYADILAVIVSTLSNMLLDIVEVPQQLCVETMQSLRPGTGNEREFRHLSQTSMIIALVQLSV